MADLIPPQVVTAFKECYRSRSVLREIDDFYRDLGFDFDAEAEEAEEAGARRSRVAGYLASLDLGNPRDAACLIRAIEQQLIDWKVGADSEAPDVARLVRRLSVAGYEWDGSRLRPTRPVMYKRFRERAALLSADQIDADFGRIMDSLDADPADAITAARSLVESACKVAMDDLGVPFDDREDLPSLYKKAALALNVDPSQHEELVYKKILQGLTTTVQGLAEVRNVMGDAHGKRRGAPRPSPRHARVAAGAAWTVATFIAETIRERQAQAPDKARGN